mmetsp:Transcript_67265/g.196651  ORF Transcript_67265/g.196651 Transcript_67265/m.196651 type:complete len:202 (+) Transcript_67265:48-653(+)
MATCDRCQSVAAIFISVLCGNVPIARERVQMGPVIAAGSTVTTSEPRPALDPEAPVNSSPTEVPAEKRNNPDLLEETPTFRWTAPKLMITVLVFLGAGFFEIGGGWLVWATIREARAPWMAVLGGLVLAAYGFVACLNPMPGFGRVYAVYGGFFIVLSFAWARVVDGVKVDIGDVVGAAIALTGVLVIMLWPRGSGIPASF